MCDNGERTNANLRSSEWLELNVGWLLRRVHKRSLQSIEVVGSDCYQCAFATDVLVKFLLQINKRVVRVLVQRDTTQHSCNDKRPNGPRLYSRQCARTTTIYENLSEVSERRVQHEIAMALNEFFSRKRLHHEAIKRMTEAFCALVIRAQHQCTGSKGQDKNN